ncbi:hypothetical protein PV326_000314, partial [Microctonus aethiopoides]
VEFLLSEDYSEKAGKKPSKNKFLQFESDSTMSEKIKHKTSTSTDVLPDTHVNKPIRYGFATSTPMTEPNIRVRERERKSLSLLSPIPQNQISMEVKRRSSHNREKLIDEKRRIKIDEENLIDGSENEKDTPLIISGGSEIASRKPQQLIMTTNDGSINNEMEENALTVENQEIPVSSTTSDDSEEEIINEKKTNKSEELLILPEKEITRNEPVLRRSQRTRKVNIKCPCCVNGTAHKPQATRVNIPSKSEKENVNKTQQIPHINMPTILKQITEESREKSNISSLHDLTTENIKDIPSQSMLTNRSTNFDNNKDNDDPIINTSKNKSQKNITKDNSIMQLPEISMNKTDQINKSIDKSMPINQFDQSKTINHSLSNQNNNNNSNDIQPFINIIDSRDNLKMKKDNYICFLSADGTVSSEISERFIEKGWLKNVNPHTKFETGDILINEIKKKFIFGLVVQEDDTSTLKEENFSLAFMNSKEYMIESNIESASISQDCAVEKK